MAVITETRGPNLTALNDPLSYSSQTTAFWSPCELDVSSVLWKVAAGTYELWVDGTLINTRTLASTTEANMLTGAGNLALDSGPHEFKLVRTSGANWRYYEDRNAHVDGWYHSGNWLEPIADGDQRIVPMRHPAELNDSHYTRIAPPGTSRSILGESYKEISWEVTVSAGKWAAGLWIDTYNPSTTGPRGAFEVLIDGRLVGTTAGTRTDEWGGPGGAWVRFWEPFQFSTGQTYLIRVRVRLTSSSVSGALLFVSYSAGTSYTQNGVTYGEWDQRAGTVVGHQIVLSTTAVPTPTEIAESRGWFALAGASSDPEIPDHSSDPTADALTSQTVDVWFTTPIELDTLWWYVPAGSYQLRIDGALIVTKNPGSVRWQDFLNAVAPIALDAGPHEFKLTRTAGTEWEWQDYGEVRGWRDGWFHMRHWNEAAALSSGRVDYLVPIRLRARFDPTALPRVLAPQITYTDRGTYGAGSNPPYNEIRWTADFTTDTLIHGVLLRAMVYDFGFRFYIDGELVLLDPYDTTSGPHYWIVAEAPLSVQAGEHELAVRISDTEEDTFAIALWGDSIGTSGIWDGGDIDYHTGENDRYQVVEPVPTQDTYTFNADRVPAFDLYYEPSASPLLSLLELEAELFTPEPPVGVLLNSLTVEAQLFAITPDLHGAEVQFVAATSAATNTTGGAALSLALPAAGTPVDGDEILLFAVAQRGGVDTIPPAGLTPLFEATPSGTNPSRAWYGYRVMDGTETGPFVFTFGAGGKKTGVCIRLAGVLGEFPIGDWAVRSGLAVTPTWESIDVPTDGSMVVGLMAATSASTSMRPLVATLRANAVNTSGNACGSIVWTPTADGGLVEDGPTGEFSGQISDSNGWTTALIAVTPTIEPTRFDVGSIDLEVVPETPIRGTVVAAAAVELEVVLEQITPPLLVSVIDLEYLVLPMGVGAADGAVVRPGAVPIA